VCSRQLFPALCTNFLPRAAERCKQQAFCRFPAAVRRSILSASRMIAPQVRTPRLESESSETRVADQDALATIESRLDAQAPEIVDQMTRWIA
jgi:hypothetical protein